MGLHSMKFTVILIIGVTIVLPLSFLISLLINWQWTVAATAEEHKRPQDVTLPGGLYGTSVQGQARNTDTVPMSGNSPADVQAAPLGTEEGIEELRQRIQEGKENIHVPEGAHQQIDSSR